MGIDFSSQQFNVYGTVNSMIGGRPDNQDSWGYKETPIGFVLVVCDGMGGGPGGKLASQTAVTKIINNLDACNAHTSPKEALKRAIDKAEQTLEQMMESNRSLQGMGSTAVVLLVNHHSAHIAHLGDSRCYKVSNGKISYRTADHSLVSELVRNKAITEEQARTSPQSNVITRALGNTNSHVAAITELSFKKGDRFILCTDGIWGVMPHEQLASRLTLSVSPSELANSLSTEVDRCGHSLSDHFDNHTLAVLETNENSILKEKMDKTTKIAFALVSALLLISLTFNIMNHSKTDSTTPDMSAQIDRMNEDINLLITANSELEGYKLRYEQLTKEWAGNYAQELDRLLKRNDSLNNVIVELEQRIAILQTTQNSTSVSKSSPDSNSADKKKYNYNSMSADEGIRTMLKELKQMRDVKSKNMHKVTSSKAKSKDVIENLMILINEKTGRRYEEKFSGMRRILNSADGACLNADKADKNGYYHSTKAGIRDINILIEKTEDIQTDLNKKQAKKR